MLPTIKQLREAAGGLSNLTDEDIVSAVYPSYQKYYPDQDQFAGAMGYGGAGRGLTGSQVSSSIDNYQAGLYGVGEAVAGAAGLSGVSDWMRSGRVQNQAAADYAAQRAQSLGAVTQWDDVNSVGDAGSYAKNLLIQSLPYAGEALVGGIAGRALSGAGSALRAAEATGSAAEIAAAAKAAGRAGTAGAVGASYPSAVGDILQSQREQAGETDLTSALGLGIPYAAANAFGVEGALGRMSLPRAGIRALDQVGGATGALARTSVSMGVSGLSEAGNETFQEGMNQLGRMAVDPNEAFLSDAALARYKESAIGGGLLGGLFGGVGGWRRSEGYQPPPLPVDDNTRRGLSTDLLNSVRESPGVPLQDWINQQAGVSSPLAGKQLKSREDDILAAFNEPSGVRVAGADGQERELSAIEAMLARQGVPTQAPVEQAPEVRTQAAPEELAATRKLLGHKPVAGMDKAVDILGVRVYDPKLADSIVNEVALRFSQLDPDTREVNEALMGSKFFKISGVPTVAKIESSIESAKKSLQLTNATTKAEVVAIVGDQIDQLVAKGKGAEAPKVGRLGVLFTKLTGQEPNLTPTGAKNATTQAAPVSGPGGSSPVQNPVAQASAPVAGAVPGSGGVGVSGATGVVGANAGQTNAVGSNPGQPAASVSRFRKAPPPSANTAKVNDLGLEDQTEIAALTGNRTAVSELMDDKLDASSDQPNRAELISILGEANYNVIYDKLYGGMLDEDVGSKHGMSVGRVRQLAGNGEVAKGERAKLVAAAAERTGLPAEQLQTLVDDFVAGRFRGSLAGTSASIADLGIEGAGGLEDAGMSIVNTSASSAGGWKDTGKEASKAARLSQHIEMLAQYKSELQARIEAALQAKQDAIAGRKKKLTFSEAQAELESLDQKIAEAFSKLRVILKDPAEIARLAAATEINSEAQAVNQEEAAATEDQTTAQVEPAQDKAPKVSKAQKRAAEAAADAAANELLNKKATAKSEGGFTVGDSVTHSKFGAGTVSDIQGKGDTATVVVDFGGDVGVKSLAMSFAQQKLTKSEVVPASPVATAPQQPKVDRQRKQASTLAAKVEEPAIKIPADIYAEVLTQLPDGVTLPGWTDLSNKQRSALTELARSDNLNLAAISRLVEPVSVVEDAVADQETAKSFDVVARSYWQPLRDLAHKDEQPGDVMLATKNNFVSFEDALAAANRAVSAGVLRADAPFQYNAILDIAPRDWDRLVEAVMAVQRLRQIAEDNVIDVEARVVEETVGREVKALPAPRVQRLEKHYGMSADSPGFLERVKEDIVVFATKGAEFVHAAVRDIIKQLHAGVLSLAMIFNPTFISNPQPLVINESVISETIDVRAEVPSNAIARMSPAAQEVYSTLYPAIKDKLVANDKLMLIVDKPNARLFVFRPDGSLLIDKKVLLGKTKGDYYKGNSDVVANRITPAGLFNLGLRDATRSEGEARTAGEYDFKKVFVLDKAIDGEYSVTLFHSVWTHEADGQQRLNALKTEDPANSRYSFGCINVDKATYGSLVNNHLSQMDGAAMFVVPDNQAETKEFLTGDTAQNKSGKDELTRATFTPKTQTVTRTVRAEKFASTDQATRFAQSGHRITQTDLDGLEQEMFEHDLSALEGWQGFAEAADHYRKNGMAHVLGKVSKWFIGVDKKAKWDGAYTRSGGQPAVAMHLRALMNPEVASWTTHHELGHAVDEVTADGGRFSGLPEFNMYISGGKVRAMGAVAKEALDVFNNEPNSELGSKLEYPFNLSRDKTMTAQIAREELFAQLWAYYNTRYGREFIEDNMPETAYFFEGVVNEIKQDTRSEGRAGSATSASNTGTPSQSGSQAPTRRIREAGPVFRAARAQGVGPVPPAVGRAVNTSRDTFNDLMGRYLDKVVFTRDLIDRAVKAGLQTAKVFGDRINARNQDVKQWEMRVERIADRYASLPSADTHSTNGQSPVNEFIKESTRTGKWGYGKYADPAMAAQFDKFQPATQQWIKDVFQHGADTLAEKKQIVMDFTSSEYDARIQAARQAGDSQLEKSLLNEKQSQLKKFKTLLTIHEGKPYAPLRRFGEWAVVAKSKEYLDAEAKGDATLVRKLEVDPDHYFVSFAESKGEARSLAAELGGDYNGSTEFFERDATAKNGQPLMDAFTRIRSRLDSQVADGDKTAGKLRDVVSQMYLQALAENSSRKAEMRRRGIAGDIDVLRAFAKQGQADAQFMASVKHGEALQDAVRKMRTEVKSGGDRTRKSELFNEINRRFEGSLEVVDRPLLNKLTRASSLFYLALSPAYYIQNLTQPFMMSVPAMAGEHDYTKAASALFKAYGELKGLVTSSRGSQLKQMFDLSKVPADVQTAIASLVNQGLIDIGMDSELGQFRVAEKSLLGRTTNRIDKGLQLMAQKAEVINRVSTAMAAYRLAKGKNKTDAQATEYAAQVLTNTHGDYTAFNAPRAFNSSWGKVALQFRKFQLIQLSYIAKLLNDSFYGKDRKVAAKALAYTVGHALVFAGVRGLPGFAALSALYAFLGAMLGDDKDDDLEEDIRRLIGDKDWATLVMRGAPATTGLDLSGKIGYGNMLSIMPYSNADLSTPQGISQAFGELMMGASGGMLVREVNALQLMADGDWYRGLEKAMPKGISDVFKAAREAQDGMTRLNGEAVLSPEEISTWESLLTGLGFQPTKKALVYERQQRVRETDQRFQDRASSIKQDYSRASKDGDAQAKSQARAEWQKLQDAREASGYKRQPMSDLLKAPQQQRSNERNSANGVRFNNQNRAYVESLV